MWSKWNNCYETGIDPTAAKGWVAQSALPDDFKRNIANQK